MPPFPVGPLDGAAFYGALPARVARAIRSFRPDAVIVQGAQDTALALAGARLARVRRPGRPRRPRRLAATTRACTALRRGGCSARPSTGSPTTPCATPTASGRSRASRLGLVREQGVEPTATFPAYMDLAPVPRDRRRRRSRSRRGRCSSASSSATRRSTCSPRRGGALAPRVPAAEPADRRRRAARGHRRGARGRAASCACSWTPRLATAEVARALDEATLLVLPVARRGHGPGRRRGVLPRPRRRRDGRGRDPRPRRARRQRAARAAGRPRCARDGARAGADRPRARGAARRRRARCVAARGRRRRRSSPRACASSSIASSRGAGR